MKLQEQTVYVAPDKEAIPITPSTTMTVHGCKVRAEKAYVLTREQLEQFGRELLERARSSAKISWAPCGDITSCGCMGTCERPEPYIRKQSITDVLPEFLNQTL